jgi:hypothetical protein
MPYLRKDNIDNNLKELCNKKGRPKFSNYVKQVILLIHKCCKAVGKPGGKIARGF